MLIAFTEVSAYASLKLALALLVLCVLADHPDHTAASNDLALDANLFYRCTDLHCLLPFSALKTPARG